MVFVWDEITYATAILKNKRTSSRFLALPEKIRADGAVLVTAGKIDKLRLPGSDTPPLLRRHICCGFPLAGQLLESLDTLPVSVEQRFNGWEFVIIVIIAMEIGKGMSYVLLDTDKITAYKLTLRCSRGTLRFLMQTVHQRL